MKASNLLSKANGVWNKGVFQVKKYSPEILMVTGIVGVVTSTVLACKATLKLPQIMDETKDNLDKIHECQEREDLPNYTEKDVKKDLCRTYTKTAVDITKIYAPAVLLGCSSIMSILASNNILKKRNVALSAALTSVSSTFEEYRKRVADKLGVETEKALRYDIKASKIEEEVTDEETGKVKTVKKPVGVAHLGDDRGYAFYWDKTTSPYFENSMDYNLMFARGQESTLNDIRRGRGYITYGDIVNAFAIRPESLTDEQLEMMLEVGNVADKDEDAVHRVDLRISEVYRELEDGSLIKSIIIDPNVEGSIRKRMKNIKSK